jgi:chorismate dehydratase
MLQVGWIKYANCSPLLLQIRDQLPGSGVELRYGVPAELNAALSDGQIDVCISSSIEFARHADTYQVLPGHCIGSDGPVQSVLLLTTRPAEQLGGERLLVTAESATSVVLLQILLAHHWKLEGCRVERITQPWQQALASTPGVLLIGDTALQAAMADRTPYCYDLGACWREMTGLPFVYALWQVTQRAAGTKLEYLRNLLHLLDAARDNLPQKASELAARADESSWMGIDQLTDYWRHITYRLDERHLAGLNLFYRLAAEQGLLAEAAQPRFLKV